MGRFTAEEYHKALVNEEFQVHRESVCRTIASSLAVCGRGLWGGGLFSQYPAREAIALLAQFAGELASGACTLFDQANWYAGAALVRQLIEVEYLAFLFSTDAVEAERWRNCSEDDMRKVFAPAAMRRRSSGRFRNSEYWVHCGTGGHPNATSSARSLLPTHEIYHPQSRAEWKGVAWGDLAQHLGELWLYLVAAAQLHNCAHMIASPAITQALEGWRHSDPCANRVSDAEIT